MPLTKEEIEIKEDLFDYYQQLNHQKLYEKKFFSVKTKHIELIIGRDELISSSFLIDKEELKNFNLISISEPEETYLSNDILNLYNNSISLKFMDVRKDIFEIIKNKGYTEADAIYHELIEVEKQTISEAQIEELKQFIINNRENKFIIHCSVGISRSSAVGLLVEEYLNDEETIRLEEQKKIIFHERYAPNQIVFFKATKKIFTPPKDDLTNIF